MLIRVMILSLLCATVTVADESSKLEFFETHIRPVLIKHCYECHAEDSDDIGGGLLLDSADGWKTGGDSGPAIKAKHPDQSVLLEALEYETMEMPPAGRLSEEVIEHFRKWIRDGAIDPRKGNPKARLAKGIDIEAGRQFWSFQPPAEAKVPITESSKWSFTDIDRFIEAARVEAKLPYPGDADPIVSLRRLCFDLTGLPPSPAMIREFSDSPSEGLWRATVSQLMESPAFAEHWARHWLDVARYADSNGSDFNATFHDAWRYRDFVIDAMASDKPFDQFVRQQIAGDLMPSESDAQKTENLVATGFLMMGAKMLSERDKAKLQMDVVDEQIDTVGRAFLGMTLGCARCHDHKFDPIPTQDYYALAGIFRSTKVLDGESQKYVSKCVRRTLPTSQEHATAVAQFEARKKSLAQELADAKKQLAKAKEDSSQQWLGVVLDDKAAKREGDWTSSKLMPLYVGEGYIHDGNKNKGDASLTFSTNLQDGEYDVRLAFSGSGNRASRVPIEIETADGTKHVTLDQSKPPKIDKLWSSVGTFRFSADKPAVVVIRNRGTKGYVIADAIQFLPPNSKPSKPLADEAKTLQIAEAEKAVKTLEKQVKLHAKNAPEPLPRAMAVVDEKKIADANLCIRGEVHNQGPVVPRGFLQVVSNSSSVEIPSDQSGRVQLADWITDPDNPLTARVIVNRVWMHLLGEGLVRTVDNFGELGARPTHPELLDTLAVQFVRDGWSLKTLIRKILMSRVYRQSSDFHPVAFKIDSENRLLWRANRKRVPAEAMRDTMLLASDSLDRTPTVRPMSKFGVLVNNNNATSGPLSSEQSFRRSMYLKIVRGQVPAILQTFDFADPDMLVGQRPATNVPTQALVLMNSPFVIESAGRIAERIVAETKDFDMQIELAYLRCLQRFPSSEEREDADGFLTDDPASLSQYIQVLLASTQYRYLD